MPEKIGGDNLFGSGGHVWQWTPAAIADKTVGTISVRGAARMVMTIGPAMARIVGRDGGPALLKGSGASASLANDDLEGQIQDITDARESGEAMAWTDDQGWTGKAIVVTGFSRVGTIQQGYDGTTWSQWQYYTAELMELQGAAPGPG